MNRIMGNPTATPMKVPDWNQRDPKKADYIKNKPDLDIYEVKPTVFSEEMDAQTVDITLENNSIVRYPIINARLNVSFPSLTSMASVYTSALYFETNDITPPNFTTFPAYVHFKGDSTEEGRFVPETNTRYTIVFDYNGTQLIGYVSGVSWE